jgi:hypothetical protein
MALMASNSLSLTNSCGMDENNKMCVELWLIYHHHFLAMAHFFSKVAISFVIS